MKRTGTRVRSARLRPPQDRDGKRLRQFDLVTVDFRDLQPLDRRKYPFHHDEVMLFLGEVRQMPGHLIVVNKQGLTFWGYHEDHFVKVPDDA